MPRQRDTHTLSKAMRGGVLTLHLFGKMKAPQISVIMKVNEPTVGSICQKAKGHAVEDVEDSENDLNADSDSNAEDDSNTENDSNTESCINAETYKNTEDAENAKSLPAAHITAVTGMSSEEVRVYFDGVKIDMAGKCGRKEKISGGSPVVGTLQGRVLSHLEHQEMLWWDVAEKMGLDDYVCRATIEKIVHSYLDIHRYIPRLKPPLTEQNMRERVVFAEWALSKLNE